MSDKMKSVHGLVILTLTLFICTLSFAQTTLSTLNNPDPHVGAALTTDALGYVSDMRVGTKVGDVYVELQWIDYLTKFVILNGGVPVEIKEGSANLAAWDNNPAAPVADGYFIPARFEDWSYHAVNSPQVWHSVIEYESGADHVIGGVGYTLLDPSPTLGFPYAELNPAYQFTNVGAANATLRTIHYERNAQPGTTIYSNNGGGQWDYDNADGTSDDFVAVTSAATPLAYFSFAGFPLARYRIQSSALDLLDDLQTAAANYNLVSSANAVVNAAVEASFQVSEVTLAPGEAIFYWLYPKPIKVVNTTADHPTDIDFEKKNVNSTDVDYAFANTDVSIRYSAINYKTNGAAVTADKMFTTVAEITGGIVASNVSGALDHVSSVRYWEIFYDTRRLTTMKDITFTYDPANDVIDDEDSLTLAYRTDYSQDWTEWIGVVQDQNNNTLKAISVNLGDSQWIIASTSSDNPLPVELTSFSGTASGQSVVLRWLTATETDNYGFEVERSDGGFNWEKIGFVAGHGTRTSPAEYSFLDKHLPAGVYAYRLKQIDTDGGFEYSHDIDVTVGVSRFELLQSYPNPFNPSTTIRFNLPVAGKVSLIVYDIAGKEVRQLLDEHLPAGRHNTTWDGRDTFGQIVASGMYFYKISAGRFAAIKKMLYVH